MMRTRVVLLLTLAACNPLDIGGPQPKDDPEAVPDDVTDALAEMPDAQVLMWTADHLPTYIVGEMMKVGAVQTDDPTAADTALRPALTPILNAFRLTNANLNLRKMNVDDEGGRHFRYTQTHNGLPVIGGDLVVHVDVKGAVIGVNGSARGDISANLGKSPIAQSTVLAAINGDSRFIGLATTATRIVYIETDDGVMHKAYEATVEGKRGLDPARDLVYVDQDNGHIVAVYPQIHFAENRKVYSLGGGTTLPGTLKRSEGQAATTDADVNAAYDNTGAAYEAYKAFFNRDSYNNAGGTLTSSVHYSTNYCNAYWNGSQMVYGDGSAAQNCAPLARSVDVTAHELTHGVTQFESNLNYSGESGGMNEAMSDIFGAFVEAWVDGGKTGTNLVISADTWKVGEDILPPALRYMCDPAADGASKDFWSSSVGSADVHYSSGVGNLAFCLLAKGGTHPRGKSNINVPALGMDKAIRVLYKAQTDILTSTSNYATVRTAMEQAATTLYDQATKDNVGCAWAAVGVGTAPSTCGGTTPPPTPTPTDGTLTNNVPVTGLSGATGSQLFWKIDVPAGQSTLTISISGGTGDADMYVQSGTKPTTTSYACRPYLNGNAETCTFSPPAQGTYWVMLNGYAAYSGLTLKAVYSAGGGTTGDPYLSNGVAVTTSDVAGGAKYWRVAAPASKTITIKISGGTGDADLYTRFGARPTTSTYSCRPYLNGNNETCSVSTTTAGDYYVMVRGYTAYSGVSLIASY